MTQNVPEEPGAYRLQKTENIIYVGSAVNLRERFSDWQNNPENPCVKRMGWDKFVWQKTRSLSEARALELQWYEQFKPVCNLVTPPGRG